MTNRIFRNLTLVLLLIFPAAFAFSAPLFQITDAGTGITIRTTVPNHVYPIAGIKLTTPDFLIANAGSECSRATNGFCLFSVSNSMPKKLTISGFTFGHVSMIVCLNGVGALSCQKFTVFVSKPIPHYRIQGTISGLTKSGLRLQNNGTDTISIEAGKQFFSFPIPVVQGRPYNVTVLKNPIGQLCHVVNGAGTAPPTQPIKVICEDIQKFTVGGQITGLTNRGLALQNNGETLFVQPISPISQNFQFTIPVVKGTPYNVTIFRNPTNQICKVSNGSGIATHNVTNVLVTCNPKKPLGFAYISNASSGTLGITTRCVINNNGFLANCTQEPVGGTEGVQMGLTVNEAGNTLYVSQESGLYVCQLDSQGHIIQNPGCGLAVNYNPFQGGTNNIGNGIDVAIGQGGAYAFISDSESNPGTVWACQIINSMGNASNCSNSGATGLISPQGMVLNHAQDTAFIVDMGNVPANAGVNICQASASTLSNCTYYRNSAVFNTPFDITLNNSASKAYISDYDPSGFVRVVLCQLIGNTIQSCTAQKTNINITANPIAQPGIAVSEDNTQVYITNLSSTVYSCPIRVDGSLGTCKSTSNTNVIQGYFVAVAQ